MTTRIVCLANSFKEGGRCVAGIEIDKKNNPVFTNGRRNWIRPVCNTAHGEIPTELVSHLNILDIIEIDITGNSKINYQTENVTFNENSIRNVGTYSIDHLDKLCENRPLLFGNKGKAVSQDAIESLTHSLIFAKTDSFEVITKTYEDTPDKKQIRLEFTYHAHQYDFPVTDPVFLEKYQSDPKMLQTVKELFLTLSLGILWKDWYYKLVAGIIYAAS